MWLKPSHEICLCTGASLHSEPTPWFWVSWQDRCRGAESKGPANSHAREAMLGVLPSLCSLLMTQVRKSLTGAQSKSPIQTHPLTSDDCCKALSFEALCYTAKISSWEIPCILGAKLSLIESAMQIAGVPGSTNFCSPIESPVSQHCYCSRVISASATS